MRHVLETLFQPGDVVEVRVLDVPKASTAAGYFNDFDKLEQEARRYDGRANIYFSLNPVNPALLARANNRLVERPKATTSDNDITDRRWLLIDCDPIRPAGIMATEEEKQPAQDKIKQVYAALKGKGWPAPIVCDSGSGYHLLYRVDLPNDGPVRDLVSNCLKTISMQFDDNKTTIDTSVYNAARIVRLYGTLNRKGENLPERPHRRSQIIKVPDELKTVTREQLDALAAILPKQESRREQAGDFDLERWIADHNLPVAFSGPWQGGYKWVLNPCPWNPAHTNRSAFIIQFPGGAIGAGCHHNSCQGKSWRDLRDMYEPDRPKKTREQIKSNVRPEERAWPEPEPIKNELAQVEQLPPEIIPKPFRKWLTDISWRMQCPIDFVAASAVVVAGVIIGAGCGIHPKQNDDWTVIPNLWGGVVARPSMLKTPALAEVMKPLARLEIEAKEKYENELNYFEAENEAFKAQKDALKSEMLAAAKGRVKNGIAPPDMENVKRRFTELEESEKPVRRRYKTNDTTIEKVAELLNENPRGILIFRDELVGLLTSWDREDRVTDRAFYLETWNGYGSFTTDRIGRGTIDTQNLCVSILGGIQPSKLTAYLHQASGDLTNDGLVQRYQVLVYPDEPSKWVNVDERPDIEAKNIAYDVLKRLSEMDFTQHGAELPEGEKTPFFHFTAEAQQIFNEWLTDLQTRLHTEEAPLMVEHLSKYRSLMPSLAIIFHLIDIAGGKAEGPVDTSSAGRSAAWCEYLETHARRIYGLVADVSTRAAAELAQKIKKGVLQDGFTIRDVYKNHWHLLGEKELVREACAELVEAGWLREEILKDGKTRSIYWVNPKIIPHKRLG